MKKQKKGVIMNRIVKLFSIMIIALLCASAVSASTDVDNVSCRT